MHIKVGLLAFGFDADMLTLDIGQYIWKLAWAKLACPGSILFSFKGTSLIRISFWFYSVLFGVYSLNKIISLVTCWNYSASFNQTHIRLLKGALTSGLFNQSLVDFGEVWKLSQIRSSEGFIWQSAVWMQHPDRHKGRSLGVKRCEKHWNMKWKNSTCRSDSTSRGSGNSTGFCRFL